jgi:tetraacyldisaccharide 4'-kinase
MYDKGWLKSKSYSIPIICIGNLSTGGTGKSPMIEYLISFLKDDHKVAVLSRGYKRKSKGFREVSADSTVEEVGDEPLQFKQKFPAVTVVVCEDRQTGISKLEKYADLILLDDAFQHRKVSASFNILLTTYNALYVDDCVLPVGNLREPKFGAKRADVIVVTKCPETMEDSEVKTIKRKLKPKPGQEVFFTKISYGSQIKNSTEAIPLDTLRGKEFLLVTGIANPKPLVKFLKEKGLVFKHKSFPDHHNFSESEIEMLKTNALLLTTEKDYMRLQSKIVNTALYFLPIETVFFNGQDSGFKESVARKVFIQP